MRETLNAPEADVWPWQDDDSPTAPKRPSPFETVVERLPVAADEELLWFNIDRRGANSKPELAF